MSDGLRTLLRSTGELLITLGLVLLLFCVYELEITGVYTADQQQTLDRDLVRTWSLPRTTPRGTPVPSAFAPGTGVARLYLPTLGRDQVHVVVEGVSHHDLQRGPGHYPGTALPGQLGNLVVSGHRTTYGAPFNRLDELRTGDPVVVETADTFWTYTVQAERIVAPTDTQVILPVPGRPGAVPTQALLTLTTCNPKYSAQQRLIVSAVLSGRLSKTAGTLPPALQSTAR